MFCFTKHYILPGSINTTSVKQDISALCFTHLRCKTKLLIHTQAVKQNAGYNILFYSLSVY